MSLDRLLHSAKQTYLKETNKVAEMSRELVAIQNVQICRPLYFLLDATISNH